MLLFESVPPIGWALQEHPQLCIFYDELDSLRPKDEQSAILNLEQGDAVTRWGRLIFHVADVDALWAYLRERGFHAERPRDASWGERYFHMPDPDGHELSFARPI